MEGQQQNTPSDNWVPKTNQINVSTKRNPNFYVYICKKYFQFFETVELHALGNAVSTSVIASENLVRYVCSLIL